ncbi:DNA polymerase III subunit gamma and tau [Pseudonocardia asaccharolytica]|uniref:DNA polymerase III subunit gamma/tau n=1 Tax=Pseudonocardia asaccharolytica DSM 44247 = NBRC 16224 TaxID=1123024 RepID=A0A511D3B0_9PSEU|nr:DNA polymerase III subunit gamma and tau [Pseudonocardia asaccharolytica]GEL19157.1 DNA polymerase III subunit gamma/tau [Pseudonocardia asaccharolytica DSM 44247 = NBRC 16224]
MALALYRKYRPAKFADVVGQEHVTEPLGTALAAGRINHAYLFSGPRGCGKTSSARILARSLNCESGPTPDPCGQCPSCIALAPEGPGSIDVVELDAASHGGVDDARELRDRAFYAPAESRYRVFIVDEAHMVTTQGFNALLKIVEEPPEHLVFVFATTEPDKVLSTIRSRTHHYPFRLIPPGTLRTLLERICAEEGVVVAPAVYPLVIRAGGGSARDSLSVLDQLLAGAGEEGVTYERAVALLGITDVGLIDDVVDGLAAGDHAAVYEAVDRLVEAGHDPRRFAADLLQRLRDLTLMQAVPEAAGQGLVEAADDELARMIEQAAKFGPATLSRYGEIVHNGLTEMRGATAPRLLLELLCARLLLPAASTTDAGLLERLERMERRIATGSFEPSPAPRDAAPAVEEPSAPGRRQFVRPTAAATGRNAEADRSPERAEPDCGPAAASIGDGAARPDRGRPAPREAVPPADRGRAEAPAPAPSSAPDVAEVRRRWPEVLAATKQQKMRTHALLITATVRTVVDDTLVLDAGTAALARLLSEQSNLEIIAEALGAVLGGHWRVRCEFGDTEPPAQAPAQARNPPPRRPNRPEPARPETSRRPAPDDAVPVPPEPPEPPAEEPPPDDEEAMMAEAAAEPRGEPVSRRDPEEAAIELLSSELGARAIDQR